MSWAGWEVQERKNMLKLLSMKNVKTIHIFLKKKISSRRASSLPGGESSSFEGPSSQVVPTLCQVDKTSWHTQVGGKALPPSSKTITRKKLRHPADVDLINVRKMWVTTACFGFTIQILKKKPQSPLPGLRASLFHGYHCELTSRSHRVDSIPRDLATDELSSTLNRTSSCLWLPPVSTPHFLGWGQSGKDMEERILSSPVLVRRRGLSFSGPTGIPWLSWWILYFSVWSHLTKLCSLVQYLWCQLKTDIVYVCHILAFPLFSHVNLAQARHLRRSLWAHKW